MFGDSVSKCILGWLWTHCTDQAVFEIEAILLCQLPERWGFRDMLPHTTAFFVLSQMLSGSGDLQIWLPKMGYWLAALEFGYLVEWLKLNHRTYNGSEKGHSKGSIPWKWAEIQLINHLKLIRTLHKLFHILQVEEERGQC